MFGVESKKTRPYLPVFTGGGSGKERKMCLTLFGKGKYGLWVFREKGLVLGRKMETGHFQDGVEGRVLVRVRGHLGGQSAPDTYPFPESGFHWNGDTVLYPVHQCSFRVRTGYPYPVLPLTQPCLKTVDRPRLRLDVNDPTYPLPFLFPYGRSLYPCPFTSPYFEATQAPSFPSTSFGVTPTTTPPLNLWSNFVEL